MTAKQFVEHRGWQRDSKSLYVLELYCHSKTNISGLGSVQRAIVEYLATGPGGFYGQVGWPWPGGCDTHGPPNGVPVTSICRSVYGDYLADPTPAQIRAVQRAVRRLEQLGYVDCWHGWHRNVERRCTNLHGEEFVTTRPVSELYVALRWDCEHLDRRRARQDERRREKARRDAELEALLAGNPIAALHSVFGGATA